MSIRYLPDSPPVFLPRTPEAARPAAPPGGETEAAPVPAPAGAWADRDLDAAFFDVHRGAGERQHRVRSPETWERAREDYAAGLSAAAVCDRYDIGRSAFHERARREGWRRADLPDPEPLDLAAVRRDPLELADMTYGRAAMAIEGGRALEAHRWLKLTDAMIAVARELGQGERPGRASRVSEAFTEMNETDSPE